jgi:hypothetical protein
MDYYGKVGPIRASPEQFKGNFRAHILTPSKYATGTCFLASETHELRCHRQKRVWTSLTKYQIGKVLWASLEIRDSAPVRVKLPSAIGGDTSDPCRPTCALAFLS